MVVRSLLERVGLSDEALVNRLVEIEFELEADCLVLNDGAEALLERLHSEGKTLVIASDMYFTAWHIQRMCERLGIDRYLSRYYVSGDLGLNKKTAQMFAHILKAEGCGAEHALHVGDKLRHDYEMPRSLGIEAAWLPPRIPTTTLAEPWRIDMTRAIASISEQVDAYADAVCRHGDTFEREFLVGVAPVLFAMEEEHQ